MINPSIFKAYDIRGVYDADFNDDFAYQLGLAYCQLRREELGRDNFNIVAAHDMRLSSPILYKELIRGLIDGGANVVDVGLLATPSFYFAVAHYKYDGGIIVSASHNPAAYNGFKLVRQMAAPIGESSGINDLKNLILAGGLSAHHTKGELTKKENILVDQVKYDLAYVNVADIKPLKIVIDTANAMGALYLDELIKHLPQLSIEKMNWNLDGTFPVHEADPYKLENVKQLGEKIVELKASLGVATDGDSDRIFFLDEMGQAIEPGITRAILCRLFLIDKPQSTIAYDIRPGRITYDTIIANGGQPLVTRVGHSLIKEAVIDNGAYFAGESSGHFMLNMMNEGCYEVPGIVLLKLLVELSRANLTFSEYVKPYQKYFHSGEINFKVNDTAEKIIELKEKYSSGKINELDGLSIEYNDYWFNVRASNTEPLLRLNLEAVSKEIMEVKRDEIIQIINS
ncbi:MAG: phosphomannomutase/phosphoglucomutase [Candidatus Falkowbacteria bacterium]|nr:phosphomannomutase/phosphoglucomutase [Candidatus Falkowbacteria bacterium]